MADLNGAELNPSAAFAPIKTSESRVPLEVLRKTTPAPHDYRPRILANGKEASMQHDFDGSTLVKSAAFAPIRVGAESRVPLDVLRPQTPAPHHYLPKLLPSGKEWEMHDLNGAERNPSAAFANVGVAEIRLPPRLLHPSTPAPHDYEPKLLPNGKEWSMHLLNGAELNKSAAFAPIRVGAESRVPLDVLHPPTPGPDVYRPAVTSAGGRLHVSPSILQAIPPEQGASTGALFDPTEAVTKALTRVRVRKREVSESAPPPRAPSPAKWSERVPKELINSPNLGKSRWPPILDGRGELRASSSLPRSRSMPAYSSTFAAFDRSAKFQHYQQDAWRLLFDKTPLRNRLRSRIPDGMGTSIPQPIFEPPPAMLFAL